MDPHRNIFFYYRGPSQGTNDTLAWDSQLENNATKALVNLLEYAPSAEGALPFLELVAPELAAHAASRPLEFSLQRVPQALEGVRHKVPVLLRPDKAAQEMGQTAGGRADAYIYCPDGFMAIAVETKTGGVFHQEQLAGHLRAIGWPEALEWSHVTWEALYRKLSSLPPTKDGKSSFIREQFLEYLELIGMAPFEGFTEDDFDYFVRPNDDYAQVLKQKLLRFGEDVYSRLPREIVEAYAEGPHLGRILKALESRHMWLAFRRGVTPRDPYSQSNFTLELDSEGASINAVIRNGRFDSPGTAIGSLFASLKDEGGCALDALALGKDCFLRIYERLGMQGRRIMPGAEEWSLRASIRLDQSKEGIASLLTMMLSSIPYPGIHVRLEVPRWDNRISDGQTLIDLAVNTIVRLEPIFTCLRNG